MGCDIHSVAQVFKNNGWRTVLQDVAGDNRSYDTFAILANVRNGYGFAGCDTGDGYEPICEPKGFPNNFLLRPDDETVHLFQSYTPTEGFDRVKNGEDKKAYLKEAQNKTEIWMGDHSFSWHTLTDIKAYVERMANKKTKKRGYVTEAEYQVLDGIKAPEGFYGGIAGRDVVSLTAKEYVTLKSTQTLPSDKRIYVQYEWPVNYTERTYIGEIIKSLEKLAKNHEVKEDDVRMVFGFDN